MYVLKKYCLISWKVVCRSKKQGDLSLIDINLINTSLLAKWFVRFYDVSVKSQ